MTQKLLVAAWTAVMMTGCGAVVQGNGARVEEARPVGDFQRIHIGDGFHATARLGSPASVVIDAEENLLAFIQTTVVGGRLEVVSADGVMLVPRRPVEVSIVSATLEGAVASGGAAVSAEASTTDRFTAEASGGARLTLTDLGGARFAGVASGGARLELSGSVDDASLDLSGGAHVDSGDLDVQRLQLEGSGGATGTVRASQEVTGRLSGGSSITVLGHPARVDVALTGGASLNQSE